MKNQTILFITVVLLLFSCSKKQEILDLPTEYLRSDQIIYTYRDNFFVTTIAGMTEVNGNIFILEQKSKNLLILDRNLILQKRLSGSGRDPEESVDAGTIITDGAQVYCSDPASMNITTYSTTGDLLKKRQPNQSSDSYIDWYCRFVVSGDTLIGVSPSSDSLLLGFDETGKSFKGGKADIEFKTASEASIKNKGFLLDGGKNYLYFVPEGNKAIIKTFSRDLVLQEAIDFSEVPLFKSRLEEEKRKRKEKNEDENRRTVYSLFSDAYLANEKIYALLGNKIAVFDLKNPLKPHLEKFYLLGKGSFSSFCVFEDSSFSLVAYDAKEERLLRFKEASSDSLSAKDTHENIPRDYDGILGNFLCERKLSLDNLLPETKEKEATVLYFTESCCSTCIIWGLRHLRKLQAMHPGKIFVAIADTQTEIPDEFRVQSNYNGTIAIDKNAHTKMQLGLSPGPLLLFLDKAHTIKGVHYITNEKGEDFHTASELHQRYLGKSKAN